MNDLSQQEYWDQVAGPSWVASQPTMDAVLVVYADALREATRRATPRSIVDVGCGCGATTLAAREAAPQAQILAVDVSGPMLALAEQRARQAGDHRTRFLHADAATHALPPGSVDLILSRFGVMFFEDPVAAFAHMRKWLAAAGRMSLIVWGDRADNPWMTEMTGVLARALQLPPPDPSAPGPFALGSAAKRQAIFTGAGLMIDDAQAITAPMNVVGTPEDVLSFYTQRGPLALALQEASESQRARAMDALQAQIDRHYRDGGLSLPASAIHLTLSAQQERG